MILTLNYSGRSIGKLTGSSPLAFLSPLNFGWQMINDIHSGIEPGQSAAKFKRIGMEHYIHCLKTRIANGDF